MTRRHKRLAAGDAVKGEKGMPVARKLYGLANIENQRLPVG